jgi:hypothetical protein
MPRDPAQIHEAAQLVTLMIDNDLPARPLDDAAMRGALLGLHWADGECDCEGHKRFDQLLCMARAKVDQADAEIKEKLGLHPVMEILAETLKSEASNLQRGNDELWDMTARMLKGLIANGKGEVVALRTKLADNDMAGAVSVASSIMGDLPQAGAGMICKLSCMAIDEAIVRLSRMVLK